MSTTKENPLVTVITKLEKDGSILQSLTLVNELAGPNIRQIDHSKNHFRICTGLTSRVIQGSLSALTNTPNVSPSEGLLCLAKIFCPSAYKYFLDTIAKLGVDTVVVPLALSRYERRDDQDLQDAASYLASYCIPILKKRLSEPQGDIIEWIQTIEVETDIEREQINAFLTNPCQCSKSFEIALH